MRRPANLASRPFANERLPAVLRGLALVALLAITLQHALVLRRLLPDATSARHAEAAALEAEVAQLRADGLALRGPAPDKASLARWVAVKEMVDRRSFAWTVLLGRLEKTVPGGVRLVSVSPGWEHGRLRLGLRVLARSSDAGFELVQALEDQPDFEEVYPLSKQGDAGSSGGFQFELTMLYQPSAAPADPVDHQDGDVEAPAAAAEDLG